MKYTYKPQAILVKWDGTNFTEVRDFVYSYIDLINNGDGTITSNFAGKTIPTGTVVNGGFSVITDAEVTLTYQPIAPGANYTLDPAA